MKEKTHNLRKILPLYFKQKKYLFQLILFMSLTSICNLFAPIFTAKALASLANGEFDITKKYAIFMAIFGTLSCVLSIFSQTVYSKINAKIGYNLTKTVINSITSTKMKVLDSVKLGSIAERLSRDIRTISDTYLDLLNLIFSLATHIVFFVYVAFLNIYIFLLLLGYVIILYFICDLRCKIWIRGRKLSKKANDEASSAYYEEITGIRDVKLLNIKDNLTNFANKKYEKAMDLDLNTTYKRIYIKNFTTFFQIIFQLCFFLIGIVLTDKRLIELSTLLIAYSYYGKVENLVTFISSFKEFTADGEISATRVFEIIDGYEKEEFGTQTLKDFSGKITIKDVSFAYNEIPVLQNISMEFKPNTMTAIVGKSGSGKTTILNLISKLYNISSGEILFDEINIDNLNEQSIRNSIGEVSQSPYIFNATIKQNLLFVKPDATDNELVEVLKQSQIYDDIQKMENGIDSEIGTNGIKLSGGQKQRLAIARLLLQNSKVIVFDEATSALDNDRQNKIIEILNNLKSQKTIIIVAHRLSTIIDADEIFMLENGTIINHGTHKFLMKNCKEYNHLYNIEEKSKTE